MPTIDEVETQVITLANRIAALETAVNSIVAALNSSPLKDIPGIETAVLDLNGRVAALESKNPH
jgi:outer membrane murein-binding lipoprotein Lpp